MHLCFITCPSTLTFSDITSDILPFKLDNHVQYQVSVTIASSFAKKTCPRFLQHQHRPICSLLAMLSSFPQTTKVTQGARKQRKGSKEKQNLNKLKEICTLSRVYIQYYWLNCLQMLGAPWPKLHPAFCKGCCQILPGWAPWWLIPCLSLCVVLWALMMNVDDWSWEGLYIMTIDYCLNIDELMFLCNYVGSWEGLWWRLLLLSQIWWGQVAMLSTT